MKPTRPLVVVTAAAVLATAVLASPADDARRPAPPAAPPEGTSAAVDPSIEPAISHPCLESNLKFPVPGIVAEVTVKEGDHVSADQLLAKQEDREEQVALREMELDANSTAEIDYEKVDAAHKAVVYKVKQDLLTKDAASQSEVDEAQLAVELSKAQIAVAELKHDKLVLDAQKQKIKVERMALRSTLDGVVERITDHPGEMADPQAKDGVIVVVKNDPLWVEIHPSADRAQKLAVGEPLQVRYAAPAGEQPGPWLAAKVIYFAPQADASSKTELVRLELPNPTGQRSGLAMEARLPADVAAVAVAPAAGDPGAVMPPPAN